MKIDKESEIESMGEMLLPRWRRGGKKEKKIEKNNWKFAINLPNSLLTGLDQCDLFVNWLLLKPVVMNRRRVTTAPAKINLLMFKTHFIFPHWRRFNIMVNRATDGIIFFFQQTEFWAVHDPVYATSRQLCQQIKNNPMRWITTSSRLLYGLQ